MAEHIAILVTGMHRSGTSALARTTALLGATLPTDLVPPNEGNPQGHWEPRDIVELNDRMLADAGSDVYGITDFDRGWFSAPRASHFVSEAVDVIRRSYRSDPFIVLKDPRVALLLPIWEEALTRCDYRIVHVLPIRHPQSVADSLTRRHRKAFSYDAWQRPRGEAVWFRYTAAAIQGSRHYPRSFVRYGDFVADWRREMERVAAETGILWPRLGSAAELAIDAFLHDNKQADKPAVQLDDLHESSLRQFGLAKLSDQLHALLVSRGDDQGAIDSLIAVYRERVHGTRDLTHAFESLYPLVWRFHEDAKNNAAQVAELKRSEQTRHATLQDMWATLTGSSDEKARLRHDLASSEERVRGIEHNLNRAEDAHAETRRSWDALHHELQRAEDRHGRSDHRIRELEADLSAVRNSTSWRLTAPLRAVVRLLRG